MFKNIYYNRRQNKMTLVEHIDGKDVKTQEKVSHSYYIEDKTKQSDITDIYGTPVIKQETENLDSIKAMVSAGVKTFETDISVEIKYLQDRYKGKELVPDIKTFNIGYGDIEIAVEDEFPKPEEAKYPINLISFKSTKTGEMYTFGTEEYTNTESKYVENYYYIPNELDMLVKFVQWFRKQKFDIITGWNFNAVPSQNVSGFDVPYIINRIKLLTANNEELKGLENKLSPLNMVDYDKRNNMYTIKGVIILDYLALYKTFTFDTKPSYSLQAIGVHEVGEGKLELDGGIHDMYKTDWNGFTDYNVQDVLLIEKIEEKMKFLEQTIHTCYQCLIPLDRVYSSLSRVTGYILRHLHEHGMVMPNKSNKHHDWWKHEGYFKCNGELQNVKTEDGETTFDDFKVKGGHCWANPGFYEYNISVDATSLYPKMIGMYNISPETKVIKPSEQQIMDDNLIESCINGVYYQQGEGVLPTIVDRIFQERKMYKRKMFDAYNRGDKAGADFYDSQQMIRKILINTFYGVLINKHFHFYDVDNARAITRAGRVSIRYLADQTNNYFKNYWHKVGVKHFPNAPTNDQIKNPIVCVIDTDSVVGDTLVKTEFGDIKIEDLFNKTKNVVDKGNGNLIGTLGGRTNALSYNHTEEKLEMNNINYVMKHKVKKEMFKVTVNGKTVTMTSDHSIIVKRNCVVMDISPKDIISGDQILFIK